MKAEEGITCIIPFYNEGQRLFSTLKVITQIPKISEVICIDDGSTDATSDKIDLNFPKTKILKHKKNHGKANAVKTGINHAQNELILLLDADLQGINKEELETAINAMLLDRSIDMVILRRINAAWFVKFDRADILLSGERLMKKSDLHEIFKQNINGYQLEVAINTYMLEHNKNVKWASWSATNTYKTKKCGVVKGVIREVKMYSSIFSFTGASSFIKQYTTFARNQLEV